MKGQYILSILLPHGKDIMIGKLGTFHFPKGCYAYVGSALRGIEARVERHLRARKKLHWHIDYLLKYSKVTEVEFFPSMEKKDECLLAQRIGREGTVLVRGFGSSDCSCETHLFYLGDKGRPHCQGRKT